MTSKLRFTWKIASSQRLAFSDCLKNQDHAWNVAEKQLPVSTGAWPVRTCQHQRAPEIHKIIRWITREQLPCQNWTNNPSPNWWHLMEPLTGIVWKTTWKLPIPHTYLWYPLINCLLISCLRIVAVPASKLQKSHPASYTRQYQGISSSSKICQRVELGLLRAFNSKICLSFGMKLESSEATYPLMLCINIYAKRETQS